MAITKLYVTFPVISDQIIAESLYFVMTIDGVSTEYRILDEHKSHGEWQIPAMTISVDKNARFDYILDTSKHSVKFAETMKVEIYDSWGDMEVIDFTVVNNQNQYTEWNMSVAIEIFEQNSVNVKVVPDDVKPVKDSLFSHIYVIEEEELINLYKESLNTSPDNYNLLQYITAIHYFPFINYDPDDTLKSVVVNKGGTTAKGIEISDGINHVNLGTIDLNVKNVNNVGYSNMTITLYVPNLDPIELDPIDVFGHKIRLSMMMDLFSGKGTLNIYNYRTNSIMKTVSGQFSSKIPYALQENVTLDLSSSKILTNFVIPYVDIRYLVPNNQIVSNKIESTEIQKGNKRYFKSDNISPNLFGTVTEQEMLQKLIKEGIIING